jgi:hypothetical protein
MGTLHPLMSAGASELITIPGFEAHFQVHRREWSSSVLRPHRDVPASEQGAR